MIYITKLSDTLLVVFVRMTINDKISNKLGMQYIYTNLF